MPTDLTYGLSDIHIGPSGQLPASCHRRGSWLTNSTVGNVLQPLKIIFGLAPLTFSAWKDFWKPTAVHLRSLSPPLFSAQAALCRDAFTRVCPRNLEGRAYSHMMEKIQPRVGDRRVMRVGVHEAAAQRLAHLLLSPCREQHAIQDLDQGVLCLRYQVPSKCCCVSSAATFHH